MAVVQGMSSLVSSVSNGYWIGTPVGQPEAILYSASDGGVVALGNTKYVAWLAMGYTAWPWPQDENRAVTVAALDAILVSYGLPPTGLTPPTQTQLMAYANAKLAALRAIPRSYVLGSGVSVKADATADTIGLVKGLADDWGAVYPTATQGWIDDFGVVTVITGAQAVTLKTAGAIYIQSLYAMLATAASGVGTVTITTTAQIDALAWPA